MESNKILSDIFRTIRSDYAGWEQKQARHNPSPAVTTLGQAYFDRRSSALLVLQVVSQYCAGLRDRNLRFALAEGVEGYRPFCRGFTVRRCAEGMFVDTVTQESRLAPGDEVLAINRTAPERVVQNLPNPLLAADEPEREQWNGYLKLAQHLTVRHADGGEETLELRRWPVEPPPAPRCRALEGGAALLVPGSFAEPEAIERLVEENRALLDGCTRLVLDLRQNPGGCEEALLPLLPYLTAKDSTVGELFGDRRIRTRYTKMNCARVLHTLRPYLSDPDPALRQTAQEFSAHYAAMSGRGWVCETEELCAPAETPVPRRGPQAVVVLTDTWCEQEAEQLAQLAQRVGRAVLLGRNTMGCLDYTNPVTVQYDGFSFIYPMSRTEAAFEGRGVDETGVTPDRVVPWTPRECREDVLLRLALEWELPGRPGGI